MWLQVIGMQVIFDVTVQNYQFQIHVFLNEFQHKFNYHWYVIENFGI